MSSHRILRPLAAGVAACLFATKVVAAAINANAVDPAGNALPDVDLSLRDSADHETARQKTDAAGGARFTGMPAGTYSIHAGNVARAVTAREDADASVTLTMPAAAKAPSVEVTATRLKEARIALSPKIGTTVYSLDQKLVAEYGAGDNTPMNEVLLRLPGVAQDSKASGSIHVRDEHANVQYRINGIQLPEGISGFGQAVDSRFVDRIDFVTGALPAQYGLRTAGVVDIETKDGADVSSGGSVGLLAGGHQAFQPSLELFGSTDRLSYYVTGNYVTNNLGIENPLPTHEAIHDRTQQSRGFGYLSYLLDDDTRVGLLAGSYAGRFEIPNNPGQAPAFALAGVSDPSTGFNARPSADLDQTQREQNHYLVASLQQHRGDVDYLASLFYQYSSLHYVPDPGGGDLIYNGVASDVMKSNSAVGLQLDLSYKLAAAHTMRGGLAYTNQLTRSNNAVGVFATDAAGAQTDTSPLTIVDNSSKRGRLGSLYVQDEWRLDPKLTVNYGVRWDHVSAFTDEQQLSPRLNALWRVTDATAIHAGYSRYFTPPPQELVQQASIDQFANTTNAPEVGVSDTVRAERTHYFDVGLSHSFTPRWTVSVDAYCKRIKNLLDEGQFGQALILTPFNYAEGRAQGLEFSSTYSSNTWSGYLNVAISKAKGKNIVSGQSLFAPDELDYIADHFVYLDHDQRYSLSGGVTYRFGASRVSGDFIFGSGLRNTPDGAPPNSGKLADYATANITYVYDFGKVGPGSLNARVGVINVANKSYLIRDGSGIGVGAPQYGERRSWFAAMTYGF